MRKLIVSQEALSPFDFDAEENDVPCPSDEPFLSHEQLVQRQLNAANRLLTRFKSGLAQHEVDLVGPLNDKPDNESERTTSCSQGMDRDEPFLMTPLQLAIWKALENKGMKKMALATEICKGDGSRLYKPNGIKEMQKAGLIKNKRGVGYYRPDAPPLDLCPQTSPK